MEENNKIPRTGLLGGEECPYFKEFGTIKDSESYCRINPCPYNQKKEIKNEISIGLGELCLSKAMINQTLNYKKFVKDKDETRNITQILNKSNLNALGTENL